MKNYLVSYNHYIGEYEISGHTIITLKPREKLEKQIHKYFMNYYEDKPSFNKLEQYIYFGGEIIVEDIRYKEITEAEAAVINRLNI